LGLGLFAFGVRVRVRDRVEYPEAVPWSSVRLQFVHRYVVHVQPQLLKFECATSLRWLGLGSGSGVGRGRGWARG
jgi:hypothetical protein